MDAIGVLTLFLIGYFFIVHRAFMSLPQIKNVLILRSNHIVFYLMTFFLPL